MHRLFVAARPPRLIRAILIDRMGGVPGARWQDDDRLHVTLRFVGAVDSNVAEDVAAALGQVRHPPIDAAVSGTGRFDRAGHIDTVWAGIAPNPALGALHSKIDLAIVRTGLPPEGRAFKPHITLARFGRRVPALVHTFLADHAGLDSPDFRIDAFGLYESHLGAGGARYELVARYPLG